VERAPVERRYRPEAFARSVELEHDRTSGSTIAPLREGNQGTRSRAAELIDGQVWLRIFALASVAGLVVAVDKRARRAPL
jgi:hypothetical protein